MLLARGPPGEVTLVSAEGIMQVDVKPGAEWSAAAPRVIIRGNYFFSLPTISGRLYDVTADGKRFLVLKPAALVDQPQLPRTIVVVQNWLEHLKDSAAAKH